MSKGVRRLQPLAWSVFVLCMVLVLVNLAVAWAARNDVASGGWDGSGGFGQNLVLSVVVAAFPVAGILIATRRPGNAIAWILLLIGVCWTLPTSPYTEYSYLIHPLPLSNWVLAFGQWTWVPAIGLIGTYLLLLYPDGHLPSPRWRWLGWLSGLTLAVASALILVSPGLIPTGLAHPAGIHNPFEFAFLVHVPQLEGVVALVPICIVLCAASLVVRFRRSRGLERQQLKWLAFAASIVAVAYLFVMAVSLPKSFADAPTPAWINTAQNMVLVTFVFFPVAIGFAVLRYHLYDIDVVISKTVMFGTLAVFITAVYVAVVVGLGALLDDPHDPALSIAATAVVALAFGPVRERVRRFANRLVYGRRATPYEVMAGFSRRVGGMLSDDEVLPGMAEAAARGVGASVARVQVILPTGAVQDEVWPRDAALPDSFDRSLQVRYQGEPVGELHVAKPPGEPLTPAEDRLLTDLAAQAGLALHNVRLARELTMKADELATQSAALRVSRERLVTARDAQRRGLERDIRDGPARQLDRIATGLDEAGGLAPTDPAAAARLLEQMTEEVNATLEGLRNLARGIFPPLLGDKGIVPALEAHIRKIGAEAVVAADPGVAGARFDPDVEAAVYFCCLQALQNVIRHADDASATISLAREGDELRIEIRDEGVGFDARSRPPGMGIQIMQDRVDALEGTLAITSAPGAGTSVRVRLPLRALAPAGA